MASDLLADAGLMPVSLTDRNVLCPYFATATEPLSDYTFSQVFTWRNSLRLAWKIIRGHLCVFANGAGDLTLLLPPMGDGGADGALAEARELMDAYNAAHGVPDRTRIEYVSEAMLGRFDPSRFDVAPMGGDYVYDVARMIDLAGGELKSKRQERNRFIRNHVHRVETYDATRHLDGCLGLLHAWRDHQDAKPPADSAAIDATAIATVKRQKETLATELALRHAAELGLVGMVVHVTDALSGVETIKGFTFGETLGSDQSSIVVEKTDLETKGLAQFIFSEFCRLHWAHRPQVNAGDDWGVQSLAWTKNSYRPVKMMRKYMLRPVARAWSATGFQPVSAPALQSDSHGSQTQAAVTIRPARASDLAGAVAIESTCFDAHNLSRRRLQYLASRSSAIVLVAEEDGTIVGETIGLLRHHKRGLSGRLYSLAVARSHRGHGIGRQLLADLLGRMTQRGVGRVYLEVESTNAPAIALYEKLGFNAIGVLADYYGPGRSGVHMMCQTGASPRLPRKMAA